MGQQRYEQLVGKPVAFLALTSLTEEEFAELVEPFEEAFREHMAEWTLEGKRRQNRAYVSYANSPLPTPQERLLFILSYLKENPTQTYHGLLYGMTQGKANMWIHSLLPALRKALRATGDAPSRNFAELMERLEQEPEADAPEQSLLPLLPTTAQSDPSPARSTRNTSGATTAAKSASTRSKTSSL